MTTTLTVIALVTSLRSTSQIASGNAMYREKSDQVHTFGFKQFLNSRNDYNEIFKEGDLVNFGGKFTLDDNKLVVLVEMAHIIEPKTGLDGECIKWEPMQIPPSKPFINISTSAEGPLTTFENMNFIKTKSLVYTPFHSTARYVNFEIGYPKDAKWLESLNEKWNNYANFFIGGFFEAIYTEGDKTYIQVDAKLIDYDTRFRHPGTNQHDIPSPTKTSINAFALKRNSASETTSPKTNSMVLDNKQCVFRLKKPSESVSPNLIVIDDNTNNPTSPTPINKSKKRQLSDLCDMEEDSDDNSNNNFNEDSYNSVDTLEHTHNLRKGGKDEKSGRGGGSSGKGTRGRKSAKK